MNERLKDVKVAFLATDMVEQVELTGPWEALKGAGARLELVSLESGEIQGFNHFDKADRFKVDRTVEGADASDYEALVLPGGVGNPDALRMDDDAVGFVRQFFDQGKPVGAICHAPWVLIEAGVVRDRNGAIPARYVSGHLVGEGGTHAWVEVLLPAPGHAVEILAWDPDDRPADLRYITVAVGRDYRDVAPVSGTYCGPHAGSLSAARRVSVADAEREIAA